MEACKRGAVSELAVAAEGCGERSVQQLIAGDRGVARRFSVSVVELITSGF
jgi:hypothetical protein